MKVFAGFFNSESNEHTAKKMEKRNFHFYEGEECIERMGVRPIFDAHDIQLIPGLYANGHPGGLITRDAFEFILRRFIADIKAHLAEIDGIYLYLHGASKVEGLDEISGEHVILKEIRKITGPYLPIAVVMDPHGNVTEEFAEHVNILRCYRHSPHTDIQETFDRVAELLCGYLIDRRHPAKPVICKLPIMVGGERSVSTDEPVRSINALLDEAEKQENILSASFHVGYVRHDSDKLGCAVVVVPKDEGDASAASVCRSLAEEVIMRRHQFHYHGNYGSTEEVLEEALTTDLRPIFLTDSGDNCGAGSDGYSTFLLRRLLEKNCQKKTLVAGIIDEEAFDWLRLKKAGDHVSFELGMAVNKLSEGVPVSGKIVSFGVVHKDYQDNPDIGGVVAVALDDFPITVVVQGESVSFTELEQFEAANIDPSAYDIIVVKQGYISPDFDAFGAKAIMALTDGPTNQQTENLVFRQIKRPMFPYDELDAPSFGKMEGGFK